MATYRRSAAGLGYKGYPATVFIERNNIGVGTQSYIEQLTHLNKWYSALRSFLPVRFEKDVKYFNKEFSQDLIIADQMLMDAYDEYDPRFEPEERYNPDEADFILTLRNIFIKLDDITARSKIIDDVKTDEEAVNVG
jgi:hypothetical protein